MKITNLLTWEAMMHIRDAITFEAMLAASPPTHRVKYYNPEHHASHPGWLSIYWHVGCYREHVAATTAVVMTNCEHSNVAVHIDDGMCPQGYACYACGEP